MKSIKSKLVRSYLLIIFSAIIILDILLVVFIKKYYYDNSEALLKNQVKIATSFYNKYFSAYSLEEIVFDNIDTFWNQVDAEVQIYDRNGKLLMDSIGVYDEPNTQYDDVNKVLNGEKSARWIGNVDYYEYKVMSVSRLIESNGEVKGVIRFVISLENIDKSIRFIVIFFIIISIIVVLIGSLISLIIAREIINPIEKLTYIAEKMASGNFDVRSNINYDDEIGKLAKTFDYMAEEIKTKDKLKNEFISSVSHELRTPLTSIKGWAITLDDVKTDKDTLKLGLNIIEKETDRLVTMVEELLDFSRIINGNIIINRQKVNVKDFIDYMKFYLDERANREKKLVETELNLACNTAFFDKDKMKQVLINIIDNAFKFTDEGGRIFLYIDNNYDSFNVIIKDDGCGINKEDLLRVKEKFYKGKNARSKNGIGLSICDEITKLHGGEVKIESEVNLGTKVTIKIPQKKET